MIDKKIPSPYALAPSCLIVSMTENPVEAVLATWFNSRDMRMLGQPWFATGFYNRLENEFNTWLNGRSILDT